MKTKMKKNKNKYKATKFSETEFYFDDCPICQAMKKAQEKGREPKMGELGLAFEEAKKKGGIVGGKWFDDELLGKGKKRDQN